MRVRMLVDAPGSPDGIEVREYMADTTYDVPASLGAVLVVHGFAVTVAKLKYLGTTPDPKVAKTGRRKMTAPPENK